MSTDLDELVACPGFRWMPGMLDLDGVRFCTLVDGRPHGVKRSGHASMVRGLPDPTDHATLGCMLALVREAYGDPHLHAEFDDGVWVIYGRNYDILDVDGVHFIELDEFEALAAALIAAPGRPE